jgi:hypothetical protein
LLPVTTWVTYSQPAQGVWTTTRPEFDPDFPVLFVALQRQSVSQRSSIFNLCDCTTPVVDLTTTVIDGGNITTGSINANFIQTGVLTGGNGVTTLDLLSGNFYSANVNLTGYFTSNQTVSTHESREAKLSAGNINFRTNYQYYDSDTGSFVDDYADSGVIASRYEQSLGRYVMYVSAPSGNEYASADTNWQSVEVPSELRLSTGLNNYIHINSNTGIVAKGNTVINGDLSVTGTKSRNVPIDQFGDRLLYAYETPSPLFGDVGEAHIGADGKCYVWFGAVFAQTIADAQYQVFLQRYGSGDCWVSERTGAYFIVEGDPGLGFAWEVKAKQRGYEQTRLEHADKFSMKDQAYGEKAALYIENLRKERETA